MPTALRTILSATVSSGIGIGVVLVGTAIVLQDPSRPSWMLALPLFASALPVQIAWMAMERATGGRAQTPSEDGRRDRTASMAAEPTGRRIDPVFERIAPSPSTAGARIDPIVP